VTCFCDVLKNNVRAAMLKPVLQYYGDNFGPVKISNGVCKEKSVEITRLNEP
jgi:hypothetical protein